MLKVRTAQKSRDVVFDLEGDPPAPSPAAAAPSAEKDDLDRLEQLVRLRDAGALSPEEFEEQKARILG